MGKTRGEGRPPAEKSHRVLRDPEHRRAEREAKRAEESSWAERSGPITTTYVPPTERNQ